MGGVKEWVGDFIHHARTATTLVQTKTHVKSIYLFLLSTHVLVTPLQCLLDTCLSRSLRWFQGLQCPISIGLGCTRHVFLSLIREVRFVPGWFSCVGVLPRVMNSRFQSPGSKFSPDF